MDSAKARREKIIERVRALLAMKVENGYTVAEAMLVAAKAAKLMEEYDPQEQTDSIHPRQMPAASGS